MQKMLQLDPALPVVTPKGKGYAIVLIDYSQEHDLYWVCTLDATGELWTLSNKDVRVQSNFTLGAVRNPEPKPTPAQS